MVNPSQTTSGVPSLGRGHTTLAVHRHLAQPHAQLIEALLFVFFLFLVLFLFVIIMAARVHLQGPSEASDFPGESNSRARLMRHSVSIVGDFTEEDIESCILDYLGTIRAGMKILLVTVVTNCVPTTAIVFRPPPSDLHFHSSWYENIIQKGFQLFENTHIQL